MDNIHMETERDLVLTFKDVMLQVQQKQIFRNLNLKIRQGEHLLLLGAGGSGKTALLKAIEGKFYISRGKISRHFHENYKSSHQIEDPLFAFNNLIATVPERAHFKNTSNTSDLYYQQRYNSMDSEDALTVQNHLEAIYSQKLVADSYWDFSKVAALLMLTHLADKEIIKLSNGETKRLLIAGALIKNPALLLMDNPLTGLDANTRSNFDHILRAIHDSGITIIMTGKPQSIPSVISHVGVIKDGSIVQMPKSDFDPEVMLAAESLAPEIRFDEGLLKNLLANQQPNRYDFIAKLTAVSVRYGDKTILEDIHWSIRPGERWVLAGPNGSGKTTLLSLLNGDNPQAYANDVVLFDRQRGSGESIWDIKKKIGFVSPELHQYFPDAITCMHVVESGFYDTQGLFRKSDPSKREIALKWMEVFGLSALAAVSFKNVPASQQRILLLARALVKNPPLLILDEPCQGLDDAQQNYFRRTIETLCAVHHTTVIYVTHHQEEIPSGFDLEFKLK